MISDRHPLFSTYKWIKRVAIAVVGFTVLLIGVAMIILPGPAFIVIPAGLGILAIEFGWAKRLLVEAKERGSGFLRRRRRQ
jgi:tellurite resistance protein TerC